MTPLHDWAVIGAGPAGIGAVGQLIDHGVHPSHILWLDPHFQVGDFGRLWHHVPSNTRVELFLKFLMSTKAFVYDATKADGLNTLPLESTCPLSVAATPLQQITNYLKPSVNAVQTHVKKLAFKDGTWTLFCEDGRYQAKNIILAIGAQPRKLSHDIEELPLQTVLNTKLLSQAVRPGEKVAVLGASHSGVLAMMNLLREGVSVLNFYRSPLRFACVYQDWILYDDSGLKGDAAIFAKQYLLGRCPPSLKRYYASPENIEKYLQECHKVVYAIGFERRELICQDFPLVSYDPYTGIIAPGLFGLGIAYPELKRDPLGQEHYRVGLWKFMQYLKNVLPIWLNYST